MDLAAAAGIGPGDSNATRLAKTMAWALSVFVYTPDQVQYQQPEHWVTRAELVDQLANFGRVHKDCDGFAMLCRETLNDAGVPNHLVYCTVETGEGHLVCAVDGQILDCRQDRVRPRELLPYTWISMSGALHGEPWKEITA